MLCVCSVAQFRPTLSDPSDCTLPPPLSVRFSGQHWSGLPSPPPGGLPVASAGIEPVAPELQADSLPLSLRGNPYHFQKLCKIFRIWKKKHNFSISF